MGTRILGLFEEHNNSRQVVKSLALSGHTVDAVNTFTKAIKILEQPRRIDLIISDVHLQNGGNVFNFLRWIKKNPVTRDIPFVLFSSKPTAMAKHLEDGIRKSSLMFGASMYISMTKFDSVEFRALIDSLLRKPKGKSSEHSVQGIVNNIDSKNIA